MSGNFPPDYFAPDFFTPDYFGGEVDANGMAASIAGVATVTVTASALAHGAASIGGTASVAADLTAAAQGDISASLSGSATVQAAISQTGAAQEDEDRGYWEQVYDKRRKRKARTEAPEPKRTRRVRLVRGIAARIVAKSRTGAVCEARRICWPCNVRATLKGTSALQAGIDGPDRIEEMDMQDLEDLVDLYMLMAA